LLTYLLLGRFDFRKMPLAGGSMKKTSVFLLLFMSAALIVSLVFSPDGTRAADGTKVTVVYSGNMLGYTEPCG
jgi:hypothetical protein